MEIKWQQFFPKKVHSVIVRNTASKLYLIQDDIIRMWHNHDGDDITLQFFQKQQLLSSFYSFYSQEPSQFSIETLSDTSILEISKQKL